MDSYEELKMCPDKLVILTLSLMTDHQIQERKHPLYKFEALLLESVLIPKTYITILTIKAYSWKECIRDEMNQMKHKNQRTWNSF